VLPRVALVLPRVPQFYTSLPAEESSSATTCPAAPDPPPC
jgi:hypothetical protein